MLIFSMITTFFIGIVICIGNFETIIFYVKVMQKKQDNAGTLSLRSALAVLNSRPCLSLSTDGRPSTCLCICFFGIT